MCWNRALRGIKCKITEFLLKLVEICPSKWSDVVTTKFALEKRIVFMPWSNKLHSSVNNVFQSLYKQRTYHIMYSSACIVRVKWIFSKSMITLIFFSDDIVKILTVWIVLSKKHIRNVNFIKFEILRRQFNSNYFLRHRVSLRYASVKERNHPHSWMNLIGQGNLQTELTYFWKGKPSKIVSCQGLYIIVAAIRRSHFWLMTFAWETQHPSSWGPWCDRHNMGLRSGFRTAWR